MDGASAEGDPSPYDDVLTKKRLPNERTLRSTTPELVPWQTAYGWFRAWTEQGVWDRVHDALRDEVRIADGRDPAPSAAVLDSQSAKSSEGGEAIGYDAGKRVRGRKRHLLVDTNGMILKCLVHSASVQDRAGAKLVLTGLHEQFPLVGLVWVDGGYVNSVDQGLIGWAAEHVGIEIVAVPRNADVKGFQVLPRRWVVERTFAWISKHRRTVRDYEHLTASHEAMILWAMIALMTHRLTQQDELSDAH